MIHFQECDVIINGTGILADSASISQENSLGGAAAIGRNKVQLVPIGSIINNIQISYKPVIGREVNFSILSDLKAFRSGLNVVAIEIGGIEASGYLTNLSLVAAPNRPLTATASYVSFFPTEGTLAPKRGTVDYVTDSNLQGHGWTTLVSYGNTGFYPTYSFNYSIDFNYIPVYVLNQKYPKQVLFAGGEEKASLVKESYLALGFYGETGINNLLSGSAESFNLYELFKYGGQNSPALSIDFRDCKITSSTVRASINDYVTTEISLERKF